MRDVLARAAQRRQTAEHILSELALVDRWKPYGRAVVVGAVAYDLVVSPDIDMEIYCPELRIEHGFEVIGQCALHPKVTEARFSNHLLRQDQALYWRLCYRHDDGEEWKIDMWSAPDDYDLPRSETLTEPLRAVLTLETRKAILELKEHRSRDPALECPSVDLYRAVLDDGVRTVDELERWLKAHQVGALSDWKPQLVHS